MEAFVMKILPLLLIAGPIESSVVDRSPLDMKNKSGNGGRILGSKNNSKEDDNQHVTGIRRVVGDPYGFLNDNRQCYTQFFVDQQPPEGLRTGQDNLQRARYICQPATLNQQPQHTYYATMFDEGTGIAVFSAYTVTQQDVNFEQRDQYDWCPTPGIERQGSKAIYRGQEYDRGHLVPGHTFSSTLDRFISTYTYTNAVPQFRAFNRGRWSQFERRIRRYAEQCTHQPHAGTLYLLTGTAFVHIQNNLQGININHPQIDQLGPVGNNPDIAVPNSMWTAGCCVLPNNVQSFAVIGNNVPNAQLVNGIRLTVGQLEAVLEYDVNHRNLGGPNVSLFPGNADCRDVNNNVFLPMAGK